VVNVIEGFHAHSDWYFRRKEDGSVLITAPDSLGPGAHQVVTLDANTWASVVASVSASGETAETWNAARQMHAGDPREVRIEVKSSTGAEIVNALCKEIQSRGGNVAEVIGHLT
jgi:hypothetical protein